MGTKKLILDGYGSYLSMERGCYVLKDKHGKVEKYPVFENILDEVILKSGNTVTTGTLTNLGYWEVDVLLLTRKGRPTAYLKSVDDDSHVKTRLAQYEAYNSNKGFYIARQIILSRYDGQNILLEKYGLDIHNMDIKFKIEKVEPTNYRRKFVAYEASFSKGYFQKIMRLIPEKLRPDSRKRFQAYDGINNLFNLAYEILGWKIHISLIKAKLEPYLGFLHTLQHNVPSLICDLKEIYRYLIDDFVIQYSQDLRKSDFSMKIKKGYRDRLGKREFLKESKTRDMINSLYGYLSNIVYIPSIRGRKKQSVETLIKEECLLLAQYIRDNKKGWEPRLIIL